MNRITLINVISEWVLLAQSCPTLCDPTDSSPPGSSVHGILQVRILQWVAISFSRGSSQIRHQMWVSCIANRFFTIWATREAPIMWWASSNSLQALVANSEISSYRRILTQGWNSEILPEFLLFWPGLWIWENTAPSFPDGVSSLPACPIAMD